VGNKISKTRLYSPSSIGDILRIARERACQEERRTKRYIAEALGITSARLTSIEDGYSQIPFELAVEWCNIVEDDTALEQIKHIYGMDLPPTDPRLLFSVPEQLVNFIKQANEAIESAQKLLHISARLRPGDEISQKYESDVLRHAKQILDTKQAAECVLKAMEKKWGLCRETLNRNWIQEGIADRVIIQSVSQYENIKKESFFQNRAVEMGWKYE
jgi:transcriptional regulator with XRE-family HTH domain